MSSGCVAHHTQNSDRWDDQQSSAGRPVGGRPGCRAAPQAPCTRGWRSAACLPATPSSLPTPGAPLRCAWSLSSGSASPRLSTANPLHRQHAGQTAAASRPKMTHAVLSDASPQPSARSDQHARTSFFAASIPLRASSALCSCRRRASSFLSARSRSRSNCCRAFPSSACALRTCREPNHSLSPCRKHENAQGDRIGSALNSDQQGPPLKASERTGGSGTVTPTGKLNSKDGPAGKLRRRRRRRLSLAQRLRLRLVNRLRRMHTCCAASFRQVSSSRFSSRTFSSKSARLSRSRCVTASCPSAARSSSLALRSATCPRFSQLLAPIPLAATASLPRRASLPSPNASTVL
eukprot:1297831-Rhodomonas_salina.1